MFKEHNIFCFHYYIMLKYITFKKKKKTIGNIMFIIFFLSLFGYL